MLEGSFGDRVLVVGGGVVGVEKRRWGHIPHIDPHRPKTLKNCTFSASRLVNFAKKLRDVAQTFTALTQQKTPNNGGLLSPYIRVL